MCFKAFLLRARGEMENELHVLQLKSEGERRRLGFRLSFSSCSRPVGREVLWPRAREKERERVGSEMERVLGLLRVRVLRGVDLAVRDVCSSDPYVVLRMEKQKLKTRVIKKNLNPEWNEELTLSVEDPNVPVKLSVYDMDLFTFDDPMGNAEFDIGPIFEVVKMNLEGFADGSVIKTVAPNRQNCLAEESAIRLENGKVYQDLILRLRNVESGEIELQLQWIHIPNAKGFQGS